MIRPILLSFGTLSTLAVGSMFATGTPHAVEPVAIVASAVDTSSASPAEALDDAVAASVIGSISRQFDTDDVTVKLDDVRITPASIQDRQVTGSGRLQLARDGEWLTFRFSGLYDTASTEVTYPQLVLGAGPTRPVDVGSAIARGLDRNVASALAAEFTDQPVAWTLDRASVAGEGGRYLSVVGSGTADFGAEGMAEAAVRGLYDTVARRWLRVNYVLGESLDVAEAPPAIASL